MTATQHFREKRHCHQCLQTFRFILTLYCKSRYTGFCYEQKELPRTIKTIVFDSKLTFKPFTLLEEFPFGFLSPFLRSPCHCGSLEVIIYSIFRSIYKSYYLLLWSIVKRSKELSKLQCLWDFYILFHKFKEKTIFFLSFSRYYGR